MNFVSLPYILFFFITLLIWKIIPLKRGKIFICIASLFFYTYWYPPFLILLVMSGLIDYFVSIRLDRTDNKNLRKYYLIFSLFNNIGILAFFKYFNFFLESFNDLTTIIGIEKGFELFDIILPIGISFYTFQSMSYTIDVYRRKLKPTKSFFDFFFYLSFFPQLVAGPIVRARDFLPQLIKYKKPEYEDIYIGLYKITRGFFLKMVISNNIAPIVNVLFATSNNGITTINAWTASLYFAIQIFCDFAGYSDIAIGTSRIFGFKILENFDYPYLAKNIQSFWRKWHISLSTWFKDYLYIPLGGNRISPIITYINIFIVFVICGLWHGANWTFIVWGALHGLFLMIERFFIQFSPHKVKAIFDKIKGPWFYAIFTFLFVLFAWVPFRAENLTQAFTIWKNMFSITPGMGDYYISIIYGLPWLLAFSVWLIWNGIIMKQNKRFASYFMKYESLFYFIMVLFIPGRPTDFIYFQF